MYTDAVLQDHLARLQLMTDLREAASQRLRIGYTPAPLWADDWSPVDALALAEARQRLVGEIVGRGAVFAGY